MARRGAADASAPALAALADRLRAQAAEAGLAAIGFTGSEPMVEARRAIEERIAGGLHAGMGFTFRHPERATSPATLVPGCAALVVGAYRYARTPAPPGGATPGQVPGHVARYAWVDHYAPLRAGLRRLAATLRAQGWRARVLVDDNALADKAAAYRAGLGWIGKNTLLLVPGAGSWFVLGAVATDAPLPTGGPPAPDGCGSCTRCASACPTGALVAPGVLDARRCLAWLVQQAGTFPPAYREALGARLYGCDDCQEVCPINRLGDRRHPPPPSEAGTRATVDALHLATGSDEEVMAAAGRWYVPGRDPSHLRRNAMLVLGNAGDPAAPAVREAVTAGLGHPSATVRAHAVWAARRLGYDDLVRRAAADPAPEVVAEADGARPVARRAGAIPQPGTP